MHSASQSRAEQSERLAIGKHTDLVELQNETCQKLINMHAPAMGLCSCDAGSDMFGLTYAVVLPPGTSFRFVVVESDKRRPHG